MKVSAAAGAGIDVIANVDRVEVDGDDLRIETSGGETLLLPDTRIEAVSER